ncbi:MAG: DUF4115 domain-containing protein [Thalassobaculaceae bacterium]|nr:DUF4115 domain-containing protein [Thalassobaculaceae bacterium]
MPYRDSGQDPTIGQALTQARESAGLDLDQVSAQLRIRKEFLAALEEGRPNVLPGITYAIGYVRTYAAFLGLDVERAVTRFKQEAAGLEQRTQLVFPSPAPEGRVPGFGLMFASVLLAGLAYGGWYWMSERGMSVYDMVPEVPERLAALIEGQGAAPSAPTASSQPAQVASAPSGPAPSGPASSRQAPATGAEAPDSAYSTANPTSVPVTARSSSGDGTDTMPAAAATGGGSVQTATPTATPGMIPNTPPTLPAAAASASGTVPRAGLSGPSVPAAGDPAASGNTETALTAADEVEDGAPPAPDSANEVLASAAPKPTRALAATEPLRGPVPSAPRLSGLIGASEAAVPDPARANPLPASIERVVVRATGESWVQVRAEDGTTLFTRVLRNGDVYRVPDRSGLTLATGNAGALEVVVDGQPAPSLGTFGEVVRNIILDPARLSAGTAISGRN